MVSGVSTHAKSILVVEDHNDCATTLLALLARDGHRVSVARNYVDALQVARDSQFDICLLDILLPDGSGLDLARQFRVTRPHTKLIAVTALGREQDVRAILDAGFDAHVLKPYGIDQLRAHLR